MSSREIKFEKGSYSEGGELIAPLEWDLAEGLMKECHYVYIPLDGVAKQVAKDDLLRPLLYELVLRFGEGLVQKTLGEIAEEGVV